jgi:hypothetical protein
VQKFASIAVNELLFLIFPHTLTGATSRRSEKIPLNRSEKQFGLTVSRAQSGALKTVFGV